MKKLCRFNLRIHNTVWDILKDHAKPIVSSIILLLIASGTAFIKKISTIVIELKLPYVIAFLTILIVLVLVILHISKKYLALLKTPENRNVNKFELGDLVIFKADEDSMKPETLTVADKTKTKIICRYASNKDKVLSISPEELLTKVETERAMGTIKLRQQRIDEEERARNERWANNFKEWNS
ncbi:hypothetical protein [Paenibacillus konkukensis]|uniref:hypothetical protein n=1 Tax=Paenibacillus konkukensis TaxID=2020716 RepID=UPI00201D54A7|nr:hypothetical protein [Paenibacillus konkukensis]